MNEEKNPIEPAGEKPVKLGIKIERPASVPIHPVFPIIIIVSFVFIGGTLWLLSLEYFAQAPAAWLRSAFDNLVLAF